MNKVILTGRLTRDAEKKEISLKDGKKFVLTGTIAVDRPYSSKSDGRDADFFQVETWIKEESTLAQYMLKGTLIEVEGQMRQDSVKHEDGTYENYSVKVVNAKVGLLAKTKETTDKPTNTGYEKVSFKSKEKTEVAPQSTDGVPWELDL